MYCATHDAISGSPPQVRGKLSLLSVLLLMMRITPAGAGKTNINRAARHNAEDHPRGCGENLFIVISADKFMGSPPRMRGKLLRRTVRRPFAKDHPRGCGENRAYSSEPSVSAGSPPRMRGKRYKFRNLAGFGGITPADAGKTALSHMQLEAR